VGIKSEQCKTKKNSHENSLSEQKKGADTLREKIYMYPSHLLFYLLNAYLTLDFECALLRFFVPNSLELGLLVLRSSFKFDLSFFYVYILY
jgi:hypothetical protein